MMWPDKHHVGNIKECVVSNVRSLGELILLIVQQVSNQHFSLMFEKYCDNDINRMDHMYVKLRSQNDMRHAKDQKLYLYS